MAKQTFETMIAEEQEQAAKEREDLLAKRAAIDEQLTALDLRLKAAENYRLTLEGKFAVQLPLQPKEKKPRATGERAPRGSRSGLKAQIIELVGKHPEGLFAKEIAEHFPEVKGLANVLALLKKDNQLTQKQKRAQYLVPAP